MQIFHVLLRSLFDEVAGFVKEIVPTPGEVPNPSFHGIRDRLPKREHNRARLGEALAGVIASCDWFVDLRAVRDDILHDAALTLVFPEPCFLSGDGV